MARYPHYSRCFQTHAKLPSVLSKLKIGVEQVSSPCNSPETDCDIHLPSSDMGMFRLKYRAQYSHTEFCVARGLMEGKPARTSLVHFPLPPLFPLFLRAFEAEFVLLLLRSLAEGVLLRWVGWGYIPPFAFVCTLYYSSKHR